MKLITAASENHEQSLLQFIQSVLQHVPCAHQCLIVYDLGLSPSVKQKIEKQDITIRRFPFEEYPTYFNIDVEAGQYACKPIIIQAVSHEFINENIIWMDAGNLVHDDLSMLDLFITDFGVFTAISDGNVERWTHPDTLNYMQCPESFLTLPCRNAACVGFCNRIPFAQSLLDEWAELAKIRNCIAPVGSSRLNHRHDQAILTILFYKCMQRNYTISYPYGLGPGYSIHNDIDKN